MEVSIVMGAPPSHHPYSNNGIFHDFPVHKNPPAIKGYPHFPMAMETLISSRWMKILRHSFAPSCGIPTDSRRSDGR